MKKITTIIVMTVLFALSGNTSNGQSTWVSIDTIYINPQEYIAVSYQQGCMDSTAVLLRMENLSSQVSTIIWSLWPGVASKTTTLQPNEVLTGECHATDFLFEVIPPGSTGNLTNPTIYLQ